MGVIIIWIDYGTTAGRSSSTNLTTNSLPNKRLGASCLTFSIIMSSIVSTLKAPPSKMISRLTIPRLGYLYYFLPSVPQMFDHFRPAPFFQYLPNPETPLK